MKIVICDITGRTLNYDFALFESIQEIVESEKLQLWVPKCGNRKSGVKSFFTLVPSKYRNSSNVFFRFLKVIDTFFAYFVICIRMVLQKPDVFHLQWFPFISLGLKGAFVDITFIRLVKALSPRTKMFFTIHNVCPHGMMENERKSYNPTFEKALSFFDHFIVHTENTKRDVCRDLNLSEESVSVVYHGVFTPKGVNFSPVDLRSDEIRIIMYGNQNWYKGTDLLVKSFNYLSESVKQKLKVTICGAISTSYFSECKSFENDVNINWIPRFIDDDTLYENINNADVIVLPYRRISQSGVLLLAIATKRFIITSDLDNFKETLNGFPDELFFKADDPKDLARVITMYSENQVNEEDIIARISSLNLLYSWGRSANMTFQLYKE